MNRLKFDQYVAGFFDHVMQQDYDDTAWRDWVEAVNHGYGIASKFDCTHLPDTFVAETGEEALAEFLSTEELPGVDSAYLEFDGFGVVVETVPHTSIEFTDETLEKIENEGGEIVGETMTMAFVGLPDNGTPEERAEGINKYLGYTFEFMPAEVMKGIDSPDNKTEACVVEWTEELCELTDELETEINQFAIRALGVLSLMSEELLADVPVLNTTKAANRKRAKKGKRQLVSNDYRILSINLAETRRRTAGTTLKKHETPRLHWRRGHWRTIHRYTEDERKVWVKKCLVGDPDKGMVQKHYNLLWRDQVH